MVAGSDFIITFGDDRVFEKARDIAKSMILANDN